MRYSKTFFFKNSRYFEIILSASKTNNPSIYFSADGGEGDITFHIGAFFALWITFNDFIPNSWYPTYCSTYSKEPLPERREFKISWFDGGLWWDFWLSEDKANSLHHFHPFRRRKKGEHHKVSWRKGVWRIVDIIIGEAKHSKELITSEKHVLPFLEGVYPVNVEMFMTKLARKRWFDRKFITFFITVGQPASAFHPKGSASMVPHEGKGENSYDQGMDGTYSSSFPASWMKVGGRDIQNCYEAALNFWVGSMKTRAERGRPGWTPADVRTCRVDLKWEAGGRSCVLVDSNTGRFNMVEAVYERKQESAMLEPGD